MRGCTCEIDCPVRCPIGLRCRPTSPKDIDGCFLAGCECRARWPSGDDKKVPVVVDTGSRVAQDNILALGGDRDKSQHVSPPAFAQQPTVDTKHKASPSDNASISEAPFSSNASSAQDKQGYNVSGIEGARNESKSGNERYSNNASSTITHEPGGLQEKDHGNNESTLSSPEAQKKDHTVSSTKIATTVVNSATPSNNRTKRLNFENDDNDEDDDSDNSRPSSSANKTMVHAVHTASEVPESSNLPNDAPTLSVGAADATASTALQSSTASNPKNETQPDAVMAAENPAIEAPGLPNTAAEVANITETPKAD
ncbi:uncharacterized protein LOC144159551 [Haemaphysalis longicornis]